MSHVRKQENKFLLNWFRVSFKLISVIVIVTIAYNYLDANFISNLSRHAYIVQINLLMNIFSNTVIQSCAILIAYLLYTLVTDYIPVLPPYNNDDIYKSDSISKCKKRWKISFVLFICVKLIYTINYILTIHIMLSKTIESNSFTLIPSYISGLSSIFSIILPYVVDNILSVFFGYFLITYTYYLSKKNFD